MYLCLLTYLCVCMYLYVSMSVYMSMCVYLSVPCIIYVDRRGVLDVSASAKVYVTD